MTTNSSVQGYAPILKVEPGNPEAQKYTRMWQHPEYRRVAPGETFATAFLQVAKPKPGSHVIDFGCGTGRGSVVLAATGQLKVTLIDFANNCMDPQVRDMIGQWELPSMTFIKADLEKHIPVAAEYGFCTDVMEHIPPDKVDAVLNNILQAAQSVWFSICLIPDACGDLIGEPLHLSVHPFEWWYKKFEERDCQIISNYTDRTYAHFYVKAWKDATEVMKGAKLNTEEEQIIHNVRHNIAQGWQQVVPHPASDTVECMILGGGPSLNDYLDEIKKNRADGVKLLCLNGAYNWAVHHGLTPSASIVVDARPFNARFTKPVTKAVWKIQDGSSAAPEWADFTDRELEIAREIQKSTAVIDDAVRRLEFDSFDEAALFAFALKDKNGLPLNPNSFKITLVEGTTYLIASQCDPSVFEGLPKDRTYIWHTMAEQLHEILDAQYGAGGWYAIPGGSTVLLRAIPLMRMLGFSKFILYGCDSCLRSGEHHAFEQDENNAPYSIPVIVNPGGRVFQCHASMISQAQEFIGLVQQLGEEIELDVKGDGLLAYILEVGAELADVRRSPFHNDDGTPYVSTGWSDSAIMQWPKK